MEHRSAMCEIENKAHELNEYIDKCLKGSVSEPDFVYLKRTLSSIVETVWAPAHSPVDFQEVFELLDTNLIVTDANDIVLYVNRSYISDAGFDKRKVIGRNINELVAEGILPVAAASDVLVEKKPVMRLAEPKRPKEKASCVRASPIFDDNGDIKCVVTTNNPIESYAALKADFQLFTKEMERLKQRGLPTLQKDTDPEDTETPIIGDCESMQNIFSLIRNISFADTPVLILGETGVGKELVANEIHKNSKRCGKPFVKINCASIPESLLESELFGYTKGAFSGASNTGKEGLFEIAHSGTLLLDEIGDMPLALQAKLLRVLESGEVTKVGSTRPRKFDVRIIASTNSNLRQKVKEGLFRLDLYHRLSVVPIYVPPLRERCADITSLCNYYIDVFDKKYSRRITLEESNLDLLKGCSWPGNIRQLKNVIEYLVVCCSQNFRITDDFLANLLYDEEEIRAITMTETLPEAVAEYEKQLIQKALNCTRNLRKAGEMLGIDQSTVSRKIRQYGLLYR